jgi:hypothetical protein
VNSDVIFAVKLELLELEVESHAGETVQHSLKQKSRGGHVKGCCSLMCLGLEKGNASHYPWMWSWDGSSGVLRLMLLLVYWECRWSLCGIFEQNVIWSKDENSRNFWHPEMVLQSLCLGLWCLSLSIKPPWVFIVQTVNVCIMGSRTICFVQSLSWRCT